MTFISLTFLAFSLVCVIGLRLVSHGPGREIFLLMVNGVFVASYFPGLTQALPFLSFVVAGYGAIWFAKRSQSGVGLALLIGVIVLWFAWLRQYTFIAHFIPLRSFPYIVVGLSYILFRVIHVLVDTAQGSLVPPSPLRYLNYCLFFPGFVSGPIQRYQDFSRQLDAPPEPLSPLACHRALERIVLGVVMIFVVSSLAGICVQWLSGRFHDVFALSGRKSAVCLAAAAIAYLINIYANFAGYMHIVIGVAWLAGFRLPENFDRPYRAKNFFDLWARWHMTLSQWFRMYVFNPLLRALVQTFGTAANTAYLAAVAFFVTFLLMGVWHGTTRLFMVYGLLLGCGATINKLWQIQLPVWIGKARHKELMSAAWYFQLSRALTLSYFAMALLCFWLPAGERAEYYNLRGALVAACAFALLTGAIAAAGVVMDALMGCIALFCGRMAEPEGEVLTRKGWMMRIARMAVCIVITGNLLVAFSGAAPEFIYKGF